MGNYLSGQTSPYLLQHAQNPVQWYPWCEEAFVRAKKENKPIFLSIGYSTCHWCHVMAHESFEDEQVAEFLNRHFIAVKVDKEERPDIDAIYMAVCQAFTGSGGWPTTVFLTPEKKPFYAGTYFPKLSKFGQIGLLDLLKLINEKWETDRKEMISLAEEVVEALRQKADGREEENVLLETFGQRLIESGITGFQRSFDQKNGGFGSAPKFPTPHNLLFLLRVFEKCGNEEALQMAEKTLTQMCRGGIFDHIGGGFCRYSTDARFLAPHFEKMLYDNALLIMTYAKAWQITQKELYKTVAERTAEYVLREMSAPEGGFYSAQDADSEGEEGKFYLFSPKEIIDLLGEEQGRKFCENFDITETGNFEGKNIPNLLNCENWEQYMKAGADLEILRNYRKKRFSLHRDDKILTGWNALMTAALCRLFRATGEKRWLEAAKRGMQFLLNKLSEEDVLFVSYRKGRSVQKGFLDDYAFVIFALLDMYECTLEEVYLKTAIRFHEKTVRDFYDLKCGGFYLYGKEHEDMIFRPKETYDGAVFSGNSAMAHNFMRLGHMIEEEKGCCIFQQDCGKLAACQIRFLTAQAKNYPAGQSMFLLTLLDILDPPDQVIIVKGQPDGIKNSQEQWEKITCLIPLDTLIFCREENGVYQTMEGKTAYYVCCGHSCRTPVDSVEALERIFNAYRN